MLTVLMQFAVNVTALCYTSEVYAMARCLSLCLSVTGRCFVANRIIMQPTLRDSAEILVFCCQGSC